MDAAGIRKAGDNEGWVRRILSSGKLSHGNVTETKMKYFIRDFDTDGFHARASKCRRSQAV